MTSAINYGSSFTAARPEELFEYNNEGQEMDPRGSPNYDVGPNERFLMIKPKSSSPSRQINFTLNWSRDLDTRNFEK